MYIKDLVNHTIGRNFRIIKCYNNYHILNIQTGVVNTTWTMTEQSAVDAGNMQRLFGDNWGRLDVISAQGARVGTLSDLVKQTTFDCLQIGSRFVFDGIPFVKMLPVTMAAGGVANALNLPRGMVCFFNPTDPVEII